MKGLVQDKCMDIWTSVCSFFQFLEWLTSGTLFVFSVYGSGPVVVRGQGMQRPGTSSRRRRKRNEGRDEERREEKGRKTKGEGEEERKKNFWREKKKITPFFFNLLV